MARRWRLGEASSLADIGCGLCHWSRLLYRYLLPPARFAAIDREQCWIDQSQKIFRAAYPHARAEAVTFAVGEATKIPLPDNSFDVVTCQTVLMHLPQPEIALREMLRILAPGGLLICVEPNNFWNYLPFTSLTADEPVDVIVRRFEFWLRYHRGKIIEGKGNHSIGDLLPGFFQDFGLEDIAVHQSDRVAALFPPYDTPAQRAIIQQEKQSHEDGLGPWDRQEVKRQVLAGGGNAEFFETVFSELQKKFATEQREIGAGKFHAAGGGLFYLVSGRKAK